jgi:hypothetical protein
MTGKMIVVKPAVNTKAARLVRNTRHFSNTLDPEPLMALVRRGKENLDANFRSIGRTLRAEDQGAIQ